MQWDEIYFSEPGYFRGQLGAFIIEVGSGVGPPWFAFSMPRRTVDVDGARTLHEAQRRALEALAVTLERELASVRARLADTESDR